MGDLRLRVAMVELVADAADVAHDGHHEVHAWGTAGSVRSRSPTPAGRATLFRALSFPNREVSSQPCHNGYRQHVDTQHGR